MGTGNLDILLNDEPTLATEDQNNNRAFAAVKRLSNWKLVSVLLIANRHFYASQITVCKREV